VVKLTQVKKTLKKTYLWKRQHYAFDWPAFYDHNLSPILSPKPRQVWSPTAAGFLRRVRQELCQVVAEGTGVHPYTINHVLQDMIERCQQLKLKMAVPENQAKRQVMIMLTVQTMNVVHSGYYRIAV